jgi:hypothetical protein
LLDEAMQFLDFRKSDLDGQHERGTLLSARTGYANHLHEPARTPSGSTTKRGAS